MGLLAFLGLGGDRLTERTLAGIGSISLPARVAQVGDGAAWDDDPARLYFRFSREYGWASLGSSTAYRQLLHVSLMAPDATPADYEKWPPRFEPLYSQLRREREIALGFAKLSVSAGRYAQNTLDEPSHVYVYSDPARRLQIAWHAVDAEIAPDAAVALLQRMARTFVVRDDHRARFAEMRGRGDRARERRAVAIELARDALAKAGFATAAPGRPAHAGGVYVEWMDDPEPRFQLVKPLGLVRAEGSDAPRPQLRDAGGRRRDLRGSVGWRTRVDGEWVADNRDNAYLPLPGIERALAGLQTEGGTLYYYATTVRVAYADDATIAALGGFFDELPTVERAWREGAVVPGPHVALPSAMPASGDAPRTDATSPAAPARSCFGIDLCTGDPHLDALRGRLAAAALRAEPDVRAGRFDAAEAEVLAVDRDIQSAVMLGAMYTSALRDAIGRGEGATRDAHVRALHARALHWRLSAYPEPHTAIEADDYAAGRAADRAQLAALFGSSPSDE